MPKNIEVNEQELQDLRDGGGVSKSTQKSRDKAYSEFEEYVNSKIGDTIASILRSREKGSELIVDLLGEYFFTMRVESSDGSEAWPKKSYAEKIRSHIKESLINKFQLDPTDGGKYPEAPKR